MSAEEKSGQTEPQDREEEQHFEEDAEPRMPFMAHLEELRQRLTRSAIAVGVVFIATYYFREKLYGYLAAPLKAAMPPDAKLIYTAPAEAFLTYLKIAILAAIVGASPYIFWQLWRFIGPGLYPNERKAVWPFVAISSVLFLIGTVFCYMMVFPYAFQFFMSFATDDITPMLSLKSYLSFSATLLFAFGVIFQMPLVLVFLGRLGIVTSAALRRQRKFAILIMFVAGAFFTPPDVITQVMMAMPLIVLYEISIWLVAATEKKKAAREAEQEAEWADQDQEEEPQK